MKLTKVIINNFRSFGDSQVIGFNDQTVLIGNNSSGKTTVLQALSKLFSDKQNDKRFVNIGRHSNNSSFGKTQFGNTFEESDNYISKCFYNEQDDFFIRVGLPNPDINFEKYSQMMCKDISKFDKEELKKVTMKSRCYFGKKIYGSDRNPIGVLMIESRKSNLSVILGGKKKELKKKTEYEELSNLIDLNFQYILQSLHKYT
ncbi:TPA: AAA family ATPase, partial [Streptococcus suis]|nr:AAA family ATPase [Streptococcus suis]